MVFIKVSIAFAAAVLFTPTWAKYPGSSNTVFNFPNSSSPVPFKISVDAGFINETVSKVRRTRRIHGVYPTWTNEGAGFDNITRLASYWANEYDWYRVQAELNANASHYAVTVPGSRDYQHPVPLHFVHERSAHAEATPLLLLHGWPASYLEWSDVTQALANPQDEQSPAFHVVAPDVPGFGFSPAPKYPGLGPREMGDAFDALMKSLGYSRYGIVTTDLGWFVGNWMVRDLTSIRGHFSDFWFIQPNATDRERYAQNRTTPEETTYIDGIDDWNNNHFAYSAAHAQKPLALAFAMADSPVGFAGWMWDLIYAVSGDYRYSPQQIITTAMMLFIPGVYSNLRFYKVAFEAAVDLTPKTSVPTGASVWAFANGPFPKLNNFSLTPRSWIERIANVTFYNQHSSGAHFPAISRPEEWVADVRTFFSQNE